MNIQLKNMDFGRQNLLETDKIVHVKVIERKGGNSAVIELNGFRTEALIEADVPDNFLAFAEIGPKQKDGQTVKLRVLSSVRNSREFSVYNRQKLLDSVKQYLMENSLPLDPVFLENALLLRSAGIKLDSQLLKLLHVASLKNNGDFVQALLGLLQKGIVVDTEFVDFFYDIKKVLKRLLDTAANPDPSGPETVRERDRARNALDNLFQFFGKAVGNENTYRAFLFEKEGKTSLVQFRSEKRTGRERFYFEWSDEHSGEHLITVDRDDDSFRINVYLDGKLYRAAEERIRKGKEILRSALQEKIPGRKILLEFCERQNAFAFWHDEEPGFPPESGNGLFNLDISV